MLLWQSFGALWKKPAAIGESERVIKSQVVNVFLDVLNLSIGWVDRETLWPHRIPILTLSFRSLWISLTLCVFLSIRLCHCLSLSVSVCLCMFLSVSVCLSVSLSVCLSICLSVCLSICLIPTGTGSRRQQVAPQSESSYSCTACCRPYRTCLPYSACHRSHPRHVAFPTSPQT